MDSFEHLAQRELSLLKERGLIRSLRTLREKKGTRASIKDREVVLFCTNDYLGLSQHPALKEAAIKAVEEWGVGGGASRLVAGNLGIFTQLEEKLSQYKGVEASLVFSSGYTANLGVITAVSREGDVIFSDELNHASIVDACRLSKAEVKTYPHLDVDALKRLLKASYKGGKIIVTDGVFSMDGDLAPLPELIALARELDALLIVDDAHGTGVLGPEGKGSFDHWGISPCGSIQVGTFSKAIGTQGGFVGASDTIVRYLINRARPFIYSTALSPPVAAATLAALKILKDGRELRERLKKLCDLLREGLNRLGLNTSRSPAPIFAVVLGSAREAVELSDHLFEQGIYTPPIRPPTVPEGKSRIRISLSASHREEEIEKLLWAISSFFRRGAD